jgi:hypothetical protein
MRVPGLIGSLGAGVGSQGSFAIVFPQRPYFPLPGGLLQVASGSYKGPGLRLNVGEASLHELAELENLIQQALRRINK